MKTYKKTNRKNKTLRRKREKNFRGGFGLLSSFTSFFSGSGTNAGKVNAVNAGKVNAGKVNAGKVNAVTAVNPVNAEKPSP